LASACGSSTFHEFQDVERGGLGLVEVNTTVLGSGVCTSLDDGEEPWQIPVSGGGIVAVVEVHT
jgi:hypothetical protein